MLGVVGMLSEGTLTVTCSDNQEIEFVLAQANDIASLDKDKKMVGGTALIRMAAASGFVLETTKNVGEELKEYVFLLESKWESHSETFIRDLISFGMGVSSGFSNKGQDFFWFLRGEFGSKKVITDSYEY